MLTAGFEFNNDTVTDIREFDENPDSNELQDTARPRQRNRRGRKSRQRAYQRWQQRLQDRARMAREQSMATVERQFTAQRQTERTEAPQVSPLGKSDVPTIGQQDEKQLSDQATGRQHVETEKVHHFGAVNTPRKNYGTLMIPKLFTLRLSLLKLCR